MINLLKNIFSISNDSEKRKLIKLLGFKIKFPKLYYLKQRKQNPYLKFKKENFDITKLPPATGQVREIQLAGLYLLNELDYVCKQLNLEYWLDFGALLGAVRHKGFIPWDDDIDVGMMRENYEILMEKFDSVKKDDDLYVKLHYNPLSKSVLLKMYHKKFSHLFLDIFPYDFFNKKLSEDEQLKYTEVCKKIRKNFIKKINFTTEAEVYEKYKTLRKNFNNPNLQNMDVIWGCDFRHMWKKFIHNYETIFPLKQIEFEGKLYPCINNHEKYLKDVYGNYLAYPKKISLGHIMYIPLEPEEKKLIQGLIKK